VTQGPYLGHMTKTSPLESPAQGAQDSPVVPDHDTIKKWLTEDLGRARSLLQAIHEDPNILDMVTRHMYMRVSNHLHAPKSTPKDE